ncbi:penicillin-binding protein activator [Buttiauxella warmboldiae]|uniref:Penicillin-binding protein activator LpoA n=1 Tax=Buttiauxella warmboldiae TaxID=82993 RepID=A0A3N5EAK3_9ENTR|nr:penicillin-binding protein activator [Buttiauxella warmboldiae]RPH28576.1 penicillin-binding protein activator [Buttiauxella warmboldiae]
MVPSKIIRSKAGRCLPVVLAALIFAGCTTTKAPDQATAHMQGEATADSAYYLQQMQQSGDDSKTTWQLLAIHALVKEGKTQQAVDLYNQLPKEMSDEQRREQQLLVPEIRVAQKDYAAANAALAKINLAELNKNQQARYYQAVIDTNQNRPSLELLRTYIAQEPMLSGPAHQKNIDGTWQALSQMTPEQMNALVINADENTLQGWLDLQRVWNDNRNDPEMLKAGIKDWQTRYPQNPGAKTLPTQLSNMQNYKPASTEKIALLLPLSGQAAVFGRTIQQGFEAAKNMGSAPVAQSNAAAPAPDANAQSVATPQAALPQPTDPDMVASPAAASVDDLTQQPAETAGVPQAAAPQAQPAPAPAAAANPSAEIKVYDTTTQPLAQLLAQAQQDGATLVVGPLLKNNVDRLATTTSPLNILALNQPEKVQNRANICYFALSPEDEARDAAEHIWQQGHRAPLLLVPRSALGDRVTKAFADEWLKLGGGTVLQQKFGSTAELRQGINSGSGIALSGTPVNAAPAQAESVTIGGLTIPAPPTDAQITGSVSGGVDAAYIVATSDEVALIKPMITMRTGSRSPAQLYASSRSSQGINGPDFRLEMEGLQFSEIPMLAGNNPSLMQQALSSVHNDYSLARLYAMGVDAWSLANHFSQMRQVPGYQVNGNTGTLSASQDCVINRKLNWLQFSQGQIVPAS